MDREVAYNDSMRSWMARVSLALGTVPLLGGCGIQHALVDVVVNSSYQPPVMPAEPPPRPSYELLAGDLHCHVSPPDSPSHVVRNLRDTVELASSEGLDFVVLTPHVPGRFFLSEARREWVQSTQAELRRQVAALPPGRTSFVVGFEYTDWQFGHVGVSMGDLDGVLAGLPVREASEHPERFFERYVASGGLLIVNHPFTTPTNFVVSISRADLSWRPFTAPGPVTPEIAAVSRLAQGFEAFNLTTTELRDRFLLFDRRHSIRTTLARLDREIVAENRPLFAVGGSDSHSHSLRATTFVLSEGRAPAQIREAMLAGRVCIRSPVACSLQVQASGGAWWPMGSQLRGVERVTARAQGHEVTFFRNGLVVGHGPTQTIATPPGECSVIRASVDEGDSAPIYVNCPFLPSRA